MQTQHRLFSLFSVLTGFLLLNFSSPLFSQSVLGKQEIKDISIEDIVYPYESLDSGGRINYISHEPAVKLSEGELAYIWKSEKKSSRTRVLTIYNVLMEERWQTRFKLEIGEYVLNLFRSGDDLVLLTYEYEWQDRSHVMYTRKFDLQTGEEPDRETLFSHKASDSREPFVEFSQDKKQFIVYYYDRFEATKSFNILFDYLHSDERLGHRVGRAELVRFMRFSTSLDTLGEDNIVINPDASNKIWGMGVQLDNAGNVYATVYEEKETMSLIRYDSETAESTKLSYDKYPNIYRMTDPFDTHLPISIGQFGKAYVAVASREKLKGRMQLQEYNVVTFDFNQEEVHEKRKVDISSSLMVGIAKRKQAFGLKVGKTFDKYLIKEIIEMPDESIWLVTQHYQYDHLSGNFYETRTLAASQSARIEDVVLYEFAPDGKFRKAIVMPSYQETDHTKDLAGHFYRMYVDRENNEMQFITHERSGENLKGPHRIFHRKINLETGETTPRTSLYEGKKKGQGFFKLYTIWLSPSVVSIMVEDGYNGKKYAVSVELEQ